MVSPLCPDCRGLMKANERLTLELSALERERDKLKERNARLTAAKQATGGPIAELHEGLETMTGQAGTGMSVTTGNSGGRFYELYVCRTCQNYYSAPDYDAFFPGGELEARGMRCMCTKEGTLMERIRLSEPTTTVVWKGKP
jgi:hypothetical protein